MDDTVERHPVSCPFWERCGFVQAHREKMGDLSRRIYTNYCTNESADCARRQLYQSGAGHAVPPLMLPNQFKWAGQILQEIETESDAVSEQTKTAENQR